MKCRPVPASAVLFALGFAACSSGPPYAGLAIESEAVESSNVLVTDPRLHDVVRFGRPKVERVAGSNQLEVTVPILNIDDEPIQVLVQVVFLDRQRDPIGDQTARVPLTLAAGQTVNHAAMSTRDEAADWQLTVSWNR